MKSLYLAEVNIDEFDDVYPENTKCFIGIFSTRRKAKEALKRLSDSIVNQLKHPYCSLVNLCSNYPIREEVATEFANYLVTYPEEFICKIQEDRIYYGVKRGKIVK